MLHSKHFFFVFCVFFLDKRGRWGRTNKLPRDYPSPVTGRRAEWYSLNKDVNILLAVLTLEFQQAPQIDKVVRSNL